MAAPDAAFKALGEPTRRRILILLRDQPKAVGDVAQAMGMSQQAISFHLRVLHGAGLVTEQRERTRHLYSLRTDGLQVVQELLDSFWPTHLLALKRAAEAEGQNKQYG